MSLLLAWAERLEAMPLAVSIAESRYMFPFIEGVHLIGLSIAVGLLFITDLRLMGVILKQVPLNDVLHQLRPWVLGGFVTIFISGGLLFCAEASSLVESPAFAAKLVFIVIAGLNAFYFEFITAKRTAVVEGHVIPPAVKYAGAASLFLWTVVIVCGRLIGYLPSS